MDFLLITFLTLLNGVFAMSELALASSRKARLAAMAEAGDKGAAAALKLLEDPTQFLSSVQVGITSIGVLNGIVGEAAFSGGVALWLQGFGVAEKASGIAATATVVTIINFTTIIFGELVPKRIGQLYPESVARWVSRPMRGLATAAKPFERLLSGPGLALMYRALAADAGKLAAPSVSWLSSRNKRLSCVQATSSSSPRAVVSLAARWNDTASRRHNRVWVTSSPSVLAPGVFARAPRSAAASSASVWLQLQIRVLMRPQVVGA